jgi:hypothetical protein
MTGGDNDMGALTEKKRKNKRKFCTKFPFILPIKSKSVEGGKSKFLV